MKLRPAIPMGFKEMGEASSLAVGDLLLAVELFSYSLFRHFPL